MTLFEQATAFCRRGEPLFFRLTHSLTPVLLVLILVCLIASAWFYNQRQEWLMQQQEMSLKKARKAAYQAANEIDKTLKMVESAARSLAYELNAGRTHIGNLEQRLREQSKNTPLIFGVGAAYRPEVLKAFMADQPGLVEAMPLLAMRGGATSWGSSGCTRPELQPYLFAPYLRRNDQNNRQRDLVMVNKAYDYTCGDKFWYLCPLGLDPVNCPKPQLDSWQEPYFGQASQRMVEEFSLPFYAPQMLQQDGQPSGSVWANMSLRDFKKLMASMNFGHSGYGFILSPRGKFIAHPDTDYIKTARTITAEQVEGGDDLYALFSQAIAYGTRVGEHIDPLSGNPAIWVFEPIHRTQWVLGLVYQKQDLLGHPKVERLQLIAISLSLIALGLCFFLLLVRLFLPAGKRRWWSYSWLVTLFLFIAIASAWHTVIHYPIYKDGNSVSLDGFRGERAAPTQQSHMIMSEWQVEQFQQDISRDSSDQHQLSGAGPVFIPTGVFIQSLNFVDANSVKLTGYLWQKLPADAETCALPEQQQRLDSPRRKKNKTGAQALSFWVRDEQGKCQQISAGVIFPEAKDIDSASPWPFLESYRHASPDGGLTVGWYFDILLRERFGYQLYPFDVENVWLRMWHRDIGKNVILTPDLSAYPGFNPVSLPGLEADFVLPGWQLVSSFFDYKAHGYRTNFGLGHVEAKQNFPELHFNIILKRRFLGAFIGNLMPLLVVSAVLFALVLSTSREGRVEILGFSFSGVLASSSGLLFGVLIGHTELRAALKAAGLVYLESFYLIMYLMLLLVILNAYIFAKYPHCKLAKWSDNLLPKLVFWPLLFCLILIVTLYQFYLSF
ncbi:hypothetical protein [Thalassomonas haliotis]|uniref:Cache domain-containing protein n=1 Tax=Thalassomonas haliotis TaxID=485448 RepID=A0ABY7VD69_9GAMM|nr:hypothetical protein [Thalassomonas haliotis]WDE10842.1 hypothetical protein H3N35_21735 [Thalassomonas haliotis]